jgi:hypothetical protein
MVTMSEGHPGSQYEKTVHKTDEKADSQRGCDPNGLRRAVVTHDDRHAQRGGRDSRADGQIQLASDHKEADRQCDHTDFGGDVQPAGETRKRNERVASDD